MLNLELKAERVRCGLTQENMAKILNISTLSYNQKEKGRRPFTQDEITTIISMLTLKLEKTINIFFTTWVNANDNIVLNSTYNIIPQMKIYNK